jgi:L-ribulose-5-phosphate 3-epimerase
MIKNSFGIMQGRLSGPGSPPRQVFPWKDWKTEFESARRVGFQEIEWLFEANDYQKNPLWTEKGRKEIRDVQNKTGVSVKSVCAHYFVQRNPFKDTSEGKKVLVNLMEASSSSGINRIVFPLMQENGRDSLQDLQEVARFLEEPLQTAKREGIKLAIESDWPSYQEVKILQQVGNQNLGVCFDIGNRTAKGFSLRNDFSQLSSFIIEIHVKDRRKNGGSQMLGEGDTNFTEFYQYVSGSNYGGPIVFETPVGPDPEKTAKRHLSFIKSGLAAPLEGKK